MFKVTLEKFKEHATACMLVLLLIIFMFGWILWQRIDQKYIQSIEESTEVKSPEQIYNEDIQLFEYNGLQYAGYKKDEKPDDLGFSFQQKKDTSFDIGKFKDGKLTGDVVSYISQSKIIVGTIEENSLNFSDWCVSLGYENNSIVIENIKDSKKAGIGILIADGKLNVIDFDNENKILNSYNMVEQLKASVSTIEIGDNTNNKFEIQGYKITLGKKEIEVADDLKSFTYINNETDCKIDVSIGSVSYTNRNKNSATVTYNYTNSELLNIEVTSVDNQKYIKNIRFNKSEQQETDETKRTEDLDTEN